MTRLNSYGLAIEGNETTCPKRSILPITISLRLDVLIESSYSDGWRIARITKIIIAIHHKISGTGSIDIANGGR